MVSTYSIVAYDPEYQEWGVGVQSRFLSVGALVPWVQPDGGAIATQAKTYVHYGQKGLSLLKQGNSAEATVQSLLQEDSDFESRQVGVVDRFGNPCAFTGSKCIPYAGHRSGDHYVCQGNLLLGAGVLDEMQKGFETAEGDLADKILGALLGGQNAGGERRGVQSAALLIKKNSSEMMGACHTYMDIRIDDHHSPLFELNRLKSLHRISYAQNHRDKYYKFDLEIKKKLVVILQEIKEINETLTSGQNLEMAIEAFAMARGYQKEGVFKEDFINGQIVEDIVNTYYSYEPEHYT